MKNEVLSLITGFIAMTFVIISYFVKDKKYYLFYQSCCITFLVLSYLFNAQYFAMVSLSISLARTLIFYFYEKENKVAPIWIAFVLSGLVILAYFIVNIGILKNAQILDILCLISSVLYAFIFRIRNLKMVRFLMLIPSVISILFNVLTYAAIFVTISYIFELCADVVSIFKYHVFGERKNKSSEQVKLAHR